jgi:transposase, IS5 family
MCVLRYKEESAHENVENHLDEEPLVGQTGFFDLQERLKSLDEMGDPLEALNRVIPWNDFRSMLRRGFRSRKRKNGAGRPPYDEVLMFKVLVLQALYNLGDDRTQFHIQDRLSFMRFLGLGMDARVPDAKTIWLYRNTLAEGGWIDQLFGKFNQHLDKAGLKAQEGQIIDASIVEVPRQRNSKEENDQIKKGETPEEWKKEPEKLKQKDLDARWVKKNGVNHYGYKNHINVDKKHKLIRKFEVTTASVHDSEVFEDILDNENRKKIWADSAYRSGKKSRILKRRRYDNQTHYKSQRNHPLTEFQEKLNKTRSKVRVRVEHVFGHMEVAMGGNWLRGVGKVRARMKIGMRNLAYNMQRFVFLVGRMRPKEVAV